MANSSDSKQHTDFICKRCGQCCREFAITLTIADMNREPRLQGYAVPIYDVPPSKTRDYMAKKGHPWMIKKPYKGAPCPFLLPDSSCSIYQTRPGICRAYPQAGEECLMEKEQCLQCAR